MSSKFQKGKWGEALALQWLLENNYLIIRKNWFFGHSEIDLIAWHFNTLVFVEVRMLNRRNKFLPEDSVGGSKRKKIAAAAAAFAEKTNYQGDMRFDIVGITFHRGKDPEIRHIPDAFFPGLY
jgi:putative endonuclease